MSKKTLDKLEQLQLKSLRSALAIGSWCPLPLLYSETGIICMELRILEKRLGFLHHLNQLPQGSLANEVLDIKISYGLLGILIDCKECLSKFEIFDLSQYSKSQFKKLIKGKIRELNKSKFLDLVKSKNYKKLI